MHEPKKYLLGQIEVMEQIHFLVLKRLVLHAIKKCLEYFGMNLRMGRVGLFPTTIFTHF
jgi:hypothetical protein